MTIPAILAAATPGSKVRSWVGSGEPVAGWPSVRNRAGELGWVLSGKLALMGANAALMLFLAHRLELETYGLLVITISAQLLISRLLMMGVDAGMIRLSGLPELRPRSQEVVIAGLVVIAFSTCALMLGWLVAAPALSWFGVPVWIPASIVAGAVGTSLVDYGYSFRLARNEYPLSALAQGGTAIWRFGLTTLVAVLLPSHTIVVFVAYHCASLLSGLAQTIVLSKGRLWPDRALIRRLIGYSRWVGKANVVIVFSLYQGIFLLMMWGQHAATGIFGLGLTLSLGVFAVYNAYFEYLLACISSVENIDALRRFMKRAFGAAILLSLACVPVIFVVALLIPWLLPPELSEVAPIFCYLAASMVFLILQTPFEAACHYLLRPQLVSLGWLMRAMFIGVAGLILAPSMSAVGAAIAQLVGSALASVVLAVVVAGSLRSARGQELPEDEGLSAMEK